jgi:hypothetical protein
MSAPSLTANPEPQQDIRELARQVQDLQQRVLILEQRLGDGTVHAAEAEAAGRVPATVSQAAVGRGLPSNALPALGRVLLAMAGAYLLRALTDFGAIPPTVGVAIGLIYAGVWLFVAARLPVEQELATVLTCATSMLIMGPLIWEASERLKVMPTWGGAAVLVGFAWIALTLSWRKHQILISGIACVSSTLIAAALLVATRDLVPFTLALLAIAAALEFAACRDHPTGSRWLSAITADAAVILFSWLMSRENGLPEGYVPASTRAVLAAQLLLILIYIATAVTQSVVRRRTLGFFEIAQTASALLIGIGGVVWVFRGNGAAMLALGISGLIGGLACYVISFLRFDRSDKWNFRAWSTFGLSLVLAGTFLPFSGSGFWVLWCGCAIVCCWAAMGARRPTLGLHGAIYLTLGAVVSGAAGQALSALFGGGSAPFQWLVSVGVLAAAMLSCAAIAMSWPGDVARWRKQLSLFAISANIAWILSGIAGHAFILVWLAAVGAQAGRIPADTLGTIVLTTFSVALAWASTHWHRRELVWLVYGFMGLGAWKLATRDFVNERDLAFVISLLFYGGALILLPRMLRKASQLIAPDSLSSPSAI